MGHMRKELKEMFISCKLLTGRADRKPFKKLMLNVSATKSLLKGHG